MNSFAPSRTIYLGFNLSRQRITQPYILQRSKRNTTRCDASAKPCNIPRDTSLECYSRELSRNARARILNYARRAMMMRERTRERSPTEREEGLLRRHWESMSSKGQRVFAAMARAIRRFLLPCFSTLHRSIIFLYQDTFGIHKAKFDADKYNLKNVFM